MRDAIACLWIWLGPGLGRTWRAGARRVTACLSPAVPEPPSPALRMPAPYPRRPLPRHVRERCQPLDGHAAALVRPYLVAHERQVVGMQARSTGTGVSRRTAHSNMEGAR